MSDSITAFFDTLPSRIDPARVAGNDTVFAFDIAGAGAWTVRLGGGTPSVESGLAADASCTILAKAQHFEEILDGRRNAMTAFMTGKLKVKGDMAAATQLKEIFGQ
jgi:putative sterol carrier protein